LVLSCASGGACGTTAASPSRDGSAPTDSAAEAGPDLPSATDYADVTIEQDFTQPVSLPPPSTTVQGDATSLVGVWAAVYPGGGFVTLVGTVAPDGGTCDPSNPGPSGCLQITVQQDSSGAFHGTIRDYELAPKNQQAVQGPFAPATDPNVGYPTTLNPSQYYHAEGFLSGVDYRLLDPVFAGGTFSFWFSPLDLWTDWCALQTPFAWSVRGHTAYACVPQTADSPTTDFGKLVLCRNANDGPLCTDSSGFQGPCVCLGDAGLIVGRTAVVAFSPPLCSNSVCECTASQCRALLRSTPISYILTLNADELSGRSVGPYGPQQTVTFRKVHP
jgi:hypothetical protein